MLLWGGKEIYQQEFERLKNEFDQVDKNFKIVILLNKDDKSSYYYAKAIIKESTNLGIEAEVLSLEQDEKVYLDVIASLNQDPKVKGVLITRPLGKNLDEKKILKAFVLPP